MMLRQCSACAVMECCYGRVATALVEMLRSIGSAATEACNPWKMGCVQDGGAMYLWDNSGADMTSCTLSNNHASQVQRTVPGGSGAWMMGGAVEHRCGIVPM